MAKKLKVGDRVEAVFLGSSYSTVVIEVVEKNQYKLRTDTGTILPYVTWKELMKPECPWHITKKLPDVNTPKTTVDKNTKKHTTKKKKSTKDTKELKDAIKKQKDFIRGKVKK